MQKKELKRLSRMDLIELLMERQGETDQLLKELEEAYAELDEAKAALKDRDIAIAEAGSIADASLSLSGIFTKAQHAADDYLYSIEAMKRETEEQCRHMEEETKERCREIVRKTREEIEEIERQAELRKKKK